MKVFIIYRIILFAILLSSCHASKPLDQTIKYDDTLTILKTSLDTASAILKYKWSKDFRHKIFMDNSIITTDSQLDSTFNQFFLRQIQDSSLQYISSDKLCRQVFEKGKWNGVREFTTLTHFRKDSSKGYWVVFERGEFVRQTVVQKGDTLKSCQFGGPTSWSLYMKFEDSGKGLLPRVHHWEVN